MGNGWKSAVWALALWSSCGAAALAQQAGPATERRIVVFTEQTARPDRVAIAQSAGGTVVRELALIDAVVVEMPSGVVHASEAQLKSRPEVLRVDDDPRIKWFKAAAPAEPAFPDLKSVIRPFKLTAGEPPPRRETGQETPWGVRRVNAPAAWAQSRGEGVKVAVIDTGIDYDHPDLKANVAGGWNATSKERPGDFKDDNGHGTHCSGIIAAVDDEQGVVGVAPSAVLYGVKVLDKDGGGTFDDVIAGMQWAVENRMQVASMSLGAPRGNESLKAAVAKLLASGVVLVAAAGNEGPGEGSVGYPAFYPGVIAVAASDSGDKVADFSSRGKQVAVIAPGVDIRSTYMGGGYETLSGTSMATPHVAGLAALAIAAKGLSGFAQVRGALVAAARPLKGAGPTQQGAGVPDAERLVH